MSKPTAIVQGTKRSADDAGLDDPNQIKAEAAGSSMVQADASIDGHSGGAGSGGAPYTPIALQRHLGNRKSHGTRFVYSGTTFVGTSLDDENPGNANTWYRFPWEFTQAAIRSWETFTIAERYLFWRAHNISIEFKNPVCIQDTQAGDGTVSAGQNLHTQLFGYADNLYTTGIANTWNTGDGVDRGEVLDQGRIETLISSWGNHGYDTDGTPISLPRTNVSRNSFQHNFPDVKQSGMGGGNRMAFKWHMSSPYWRSTQEFFNQAVEGCGDNTFVDQNFVRWDEQFGRIGLYGDDVNEQTGEEGCDEYETDAENTVTPKAYVRRLIRNLREPASTGEDDTFWNHMATGNTTQPGNNKGAGINQYYRDPEPMPKLYLQLQPQLSAIEAGTAKSVAQVQFEIHIDIELMGQCPSVMEAAGLAGSATPVTAAYARRWFNNFGWKIPLYYPITVSDDFTPEN